MADAVVGGEVDIVVKANLDQLRAITPQVAAEAQRLYAAFSKTSAPMSAIKQVEDNLKRLAQTAKQVNLNLNVRDDFNTEARRADIEAYGKSMDDLRAKFSPLFAAQQRSKTTMDELNRALAVGAINQEEYGIAAMRAQHQLEIEVDAIQRSNMALQQNSSLARMNGLQIQNMGFQINDIAMGLMTGANPFVLITQQGLQIAQIFGPGGTAGSALRQFGAGVLSFVTNPVNLAVVGVAAAVAGVTALWGAVTGAKGANAESALERHRNFVDNILTGYESAKDAADKYLESVDRLPREAAIAQALVVQTKNAEQFRLEMQKIIDLQGILAAAATQEDMFSFGLPNQGAGGGKLQEIVDNFRAGRSTLAEFQSQLGALRIDPSVSNQVRDLIDQITAAADEMARLNNNTNAVAASINNLSGSTLIGDTFDALPGTADALERIKALTPDLRDAKEQVRDIMSQNSGAGKTLAEMAELQAAGEYAIQQLEEEDRQRKALIATRKAEADAERLLKEAKENAYYLDDLQREVDILQMATEERKVQLELLEKDRAIQAAIKQLGEGATQDNIALVEKLIPLKMDLLKANSEEEKSIERMNKLYEDLGSTVGDIFTQWSEGALTAEQAMLQLAKAAALAALKSMFMGQSNNSYLGEGTFLSGFLGSLFGGGRASGGPVQAGKFYRINENTPNSEYFAPSTSGYVVPSSAGYQANGPTDNGTKAYINLDLAGANGDAAIEDAVNRGIKSAFETLPARVQAINLRGRELRRPGFKGN